MAVGEWRRIGGSYLHGRLWLVQVLVLLFCRLSIALVYGVRWLMGIGIGILLLVLDLLLRAYRPIKTGALAFGLAGTWGLHGENTSGNLGVGGATLDDARGAVEAGFANRNGLPPAGAARAGSTAAEEDIVSWRACYTGCIWS